MPTHALSPSVSAVGCTGIHCSCSGFTQAGAATQGWQLTCPGGHAFLLVSRRGYTGIPIWLRFSWHGCRPFLQMLRYEMCQATVLKSPSRIMSAAWHGSHSIQHPSSESILCADELNVQSSPIVCRFSLLKGTFLLVPLYPHYP